MGLVLLQAAQYNRIRIFYCWPNTKSKAREQKKILLEDRQTDMLVERKTEIQKDRKKERQTDRQIGI